MGRIRLVYLCALAVVACADTGGEVVPRPGFDAGVSCEDEDHDGFGRYCERGYDCDDHDPHSTYECRSCNNPELGCPCEEDTTPQSCFLPDKGLSDGGVMCSEGTRTCRSGIWSGCESVYSYIVVPGADTQRIVDKTATQPTCSICDLKCFKVLDNLLADGGTADGSVTFADGGGLTLLPGDGSIGGMTGDAGGDAGLTGCAAMMACCSSLSGVLETNCDLTAGMGNNARCDQERVTYCPPGNVSGPVPGCTLNSNNADKDCDGIPDVVDSPGKPISTSNNRAIFHQLDIGETGQNSLDVSFKLRNADVYFLLDMTNTMKEERDNLVSSLTSGNVINCAHLNQCCNRQTDMAKKSACQAAITMYTNRAGKSDDQTACYNLQPMFCPNNTYVDCPDVDFDGLPDNTLKSQGVVGAVRCLVGSSWFGAGYSREMPVEYDPQDCTGSACGAVRYGDRDEALFRHLVDMTPDYLKVRSALQSMVTNGNHDEPEGGLMALYSLITGKGHYFGINRPAVPERLNATGCSPNSFGYPCFRQDAIPIVVFFTDRPHHNGPDDSTHCNGEGPGCPYDHLVGASPTNTWSSQASESASDKLARRVPADAESFATAYNLGDIRGKYATMVGDTRFMVGDYPSAIIGCGADANAPDTLIRFTVSNPNPAGSTATVPPVTVNFHLTKDDGYSNTAYYGAWSAGHTNDPSPATEFGSVISVFRGIPNVISSPTNVGDKTAVAIASGPDGTYLTYLGKTHGSMSMPGYLGGVSGCGADGQTNQVLFTFRPTSAAHVVFDASESGFPTTLSLHEGLPTSLPKNPNQNDNTSQAIVNSNDTFATANAVPVGGTPIDGVYAERTGDTRVASIHADYTATQGLSVKGLRSNASNRISQLTNTASLYLGMQLADATDWSGSPVSITALSGTTATMSATWTGADDGVVTALVFTDSLVGCAADPNSNDSVFKFDVATPRRVRIDTEGSGFDTVISLHDAPPPVSQVRSNVGMNATMPGYAIGDVNNASYTLSDVGSGLPLLGSNYDYTQCGAVALAPDSAFTFQLSKPTHLGLEVSSTGFDPVIGLFSSPPGSGTVLTSNNTNNRIAPPGQNAFDLGDVFGQLDTKVQGSSLLLMTDDYNPAVVGCGTSSGGKDVVFKFTPTGSTTVRIDAKPATGWLPVIALFDDPPPVAGANATVQLFDAGSVALPDSNCLAYSFHDSATGAQPAHTYTVCPSRRYGDDAQNRCVSSGMNYLASINTAKEQSFLQGTSVGTTTGNNFHIGASDPDNDGIYTWLDTTALTYTNWGNNEPSPANNKRCADMQPSGKWQTGKCSSSGATSSDNAYYICEDVTPALAPPEDDATAYSVSPLGTVVTVVGSTRRMYSDYNGAVLLGACGSTISAGDAVFKIVTGTSGGFNLSVDSAGSSFSPVLGLFNGTIDAAGYVTCDAPGGAPLTYTLISNRTYYVVVKGTASSPDGSYKLKFADTSALSAAGTRLACAAGTSGVPTPTMDVDVDANHTYYIVVDQTGGALLGAFELNVHALYQRRAEVPNSSSSNENGPAALALPDPYRSRITVSDTSTAGMAADYGIGMTGMCSTSPLAPDAVYKITPSLSTNLKIGVIPQGSGLTTPVIGVFDGYPGSAPVVHDLNSEGNPNEALSNAQVVAFGSNTQAYAGNTSAMASNVDSAILACGAQPGAPDAVFTFNLAKTTNVEIDASTSTISDPVINLFRASPLSRPAQVTLENDAKPQADANPNPTPVASGSWLYYGGDLAHLSAETQTAVSVAAVNADVPPPTPVLQPQDLGDIASKRVSIGGGDTAPMTADYPGGWSCGSNDASPDAIYRFYSSVNATVHVKATPASGYDTVLGLFDGTNGPPLKRTDLGSITEQNACVGVGAPKNVTNATLQTIQPALGSAPSPLLNCGTSVINTDDPDGSGPLIANFLAWCGPQPLVYLQQQASGPDAVVFVVQNLRVAAGATLRVLGSRPAIFLASGTVNIDGVLSGSPDPLSYPNLAGAGADFACGSSIGTNAGATGTNTGGGGGGGFGTPGGDGGFALGATQSPGGAGGIARGNATLTPLLGGCSGGHGPAASAVGLAAGAIQISAVGPITVAAGSGAIRVDGSAGPTPTSNDAGGSGGGSGGALLLQSQTISYVASALTANGGNGGGGAGTGTAANGGTGSLVASDPGLAGQNGGATRGGGAGGGGYGRIALVTANVSLTPCTTGTNESAATAWPVNLDGTGRTYVERGNTAPMTADHGGICATPTTSKDAVYAFTLSKQTRVDIDARNSPSNTVIGLFSAGSLGQAPVPLALENDSRNDADANPAPTPDIVNNWTAYTGDLSNLTINSQPQLSIDNQGNANEIVPTDLPDPINRRITVLNANTSGMTADFLAPTCSMPSADPARDAVYRFTASQTGQVRVSANYSQTTFDPVIALYRGLHNVTDELISLVGTSDTALRQLNVDRSSIKVFNQGRTILYNGPGSASPDYAVVVRDANQPTGILRTGTSTIPNGALVSVDYSYDRGAPLPITQQVQNTLDLGALGNPNERADSTQFVPLVSGQAYNYTGNTSAMAVDVDGSLFSCGAPPPTSSDAVFSFSVDKTTQVEVTTAGAGYNTAIALFDSPFSRPSSTVLRSPPAAERAIYDVRAIPGSPEANCRAYDYSAHRYWFCSQARPWSQAEGRCQSAGLHLVTIEDSFENAELVNQIQSSGRSHQIGFQESSPYTNSWGVWTSGGGGTTGSSVNSAFNRWAVSEPNAAGNCLRMLANGTWDDTDCAGIRAYVCELPNTTTTPAAPAGSTCGSLLTFNGHRYLACSDALDWTSARQKCTSVGMDLARIDDQPENDQVRALLGAEGWLGGNDSATEGRWVWADGFQFWLVNAYRNWLSGEPNQFVDNPGSRIQIDGTWVDTPFTYSDFPYVCEDPAPGASSQPPTATAPQLVDVFSPQRAFRGSTEGAPSSVGGFIACSADGNAPDAVFVLQLAYLTDLRIDLTGSFAGALVGLFKGAIGTQGYADAGSRCGTVATAAPQLAASLTPGTYYAVVTGSSAASGAYKIRFDAQTTDPVAFRMENDTLPDAMAHPLGSVDGGWQVRTADMANLTPTTGAVRTVDLGAGTDTNDVNPQALDPVSDYQVLTTNSSTGDLSAQFPGGSCGIMANGPDALYSFTPTTSRNVQVRLSTSGWAGQVVMFDGTNGSPLTTSQAPLPPIQLGPSYANESRSAAQNTAIGRAQAFLGNLTPMTGDVESLAFSQAYNYKTGPSPVACNADPVGHDAFFKFTVPSGPNQSVEITSNGTPVAATLALWDNKPFAKPAGVTAEYDTPLIANLNRPGGNGDIDDDWVVLRGDTHNMTPALGYTPLTETMSYPHDDTTHAIGNVKGKQYVTVNATTAGLTGDFLATTLQCGGTSDTARDAVFSFTHSTGGRVRVSLNNPNPAFIPNVALFKGAPNTAAGMIPVNTALNNLNEQRASAFDVSPVGVAKTYSGNTSGMANNQIGSTFTQGAAYGSSVCTPDAAGRDALLMLTVPGTAGIDPPQTVEISSVEASFDHTIALWDASPIVQPTSTLAMSNDSRNAAFLNPIGKIDDQWISRTATMSGLFPGALTSSSPMVANNNDIQDLGDPVGKRIRISANTSTAGVVGDYSTATMGCGTADSANDIIYKIRPTANTTVRVATNDPTPGFSTALAVFNGATGDPARISDGTSTNTTTYCTSGFSYTPSNITLAGINFSTSPTVTLGCGGTITFNSTSATFTSGWCSGQTQPTPVVQTQSGGPDLVVLPFKAFTLSAGTTLNLVGTRPVVFAVEGNASIAGTLSASASAATAGAGGDQSCGTSTGDDGDGIASLHGAGGGGGGFGTAGGKGGNDLSGQGGAPGVAHGNATLVPLVGGCGGGQGFGCTDAKGAGGGAVQISAGGALTVAGAIRANGGHGAHATCNDSGGNGGGSGGGILLEAGSVNTTGSVAADGGDGSNGQASGTGSAGSSSSGSAGTVGGTGAGSGGGGGGGGYGRVRTRTASCAPAIETFATAAVVPIGAVQTFNGPSTAMTSDLAGASFNSGGCTPDATGPDAFFKFTLTGTTPVLVRAQGTDYNHTLTLFNSALTATQCNNGTAATGGTINASLAAGTYYIGIKSRNSGVGGNFSLAFSDSSYGPPYATQLACTTANTVDATLSANTDYYVVVKGGAAGQAGAYTLNVTDIGAVPDFGCGNDRSAPDAFFEFDVADPAGRNVFINLNEDGTHLDGSFQLVQDGAPFNDATGDTPYACSTGNQLFSNLPQGKYYLLVRGTSAANGNGAKPLEVFFKDDSGSNALACADGSSTSAGTITRTLQPGTYYAGITSRNSAAGGTYKLKVRDTALPSGGGGTWLGCADASYTISYDIPPADANVAHFVVVKGAAAGAQGSYTLSLTDVSSVPDTCASGDAIQMDPSAPDAYYSFKVTDPDADGRDVTVSLDAASSLDGAYRLFRSNGTAIGACHDRTAPFTYANLSADTYYIALRGKTTASGAAEAPYELSIRDQDAFGAIECKDGSANLGTTIARSLATGTYYVGVRNQPGQTDPLSYQVQFRDTASVQPSGAIELACSSSVFTVPVTQNVPYYVLVKGNAPSEAGPYALTVTDLSSTAGFNCNDDSASGDAYFEFNVNDPNGRRVTIDTEGSTLDTVVALFPAGAPIDASGLLACNDDGGATAGSSKITRDLAPGVYYAVVRAKSGIANPRLPFQFSLRDDSAVGSIACGATDLNGPATIRRELGPGTYHVVLKGQPGSDKGAYKIRFRDNGAYDNAASEVACNDAQNELLYNVTAGKPYYAVVKGAAANQAGPYRLTVENLAAQAGMGCGADPTSPDAFYRFHLSADTRVQVDTLGSEDTTRMPAVPTNTVIAIYDVSASYFGTNYAEDKAHVPVNCDDDSGDVAKGWSKITANLAGNRDYYVVVKSRGTSWGSGTRLPYRVNVRDLDSNQPIACADQNSSLLMSRNLPAGDYRVVVSNSSGGGGPYEVSFKNSTLASGGASMVACNDVQDELTYNVTAGKPYYLVVKGDAATDKGQYNLVVETSGSGASMGCNANPTAPDAFFKFNVSKQGPVTIDTDGSAIDTVIALYPAAAAVFGTNYTPDAFGNAVGCDDDSGATAGASRISATLAAGNYYVVVKGKNAGWGASAQPFNLSIRDSDTTGTIACASAAQGSKKIARSLAAGDYNLVVSRGSAGGGPYSVSFRDTANASAETGQRLACAAGGSLTVNNLVGGKDYFVVVKGNNANEAGAYKLTVEDTVSLSAASGSTSVACAAEGSRIDAVYPAGTYYALVTGNSLLSAGNYTLKAQDLDAYADQNRIACDDDSGPNETSSITADLKAGTHYVVVKGKSADDQGAYRLHVRDADGVSDRAVACGGETQLERIEYDVKAGQDYTLLLKGDASGAGGDYNLKLYDQLGLQAGNGQRLQCVSDAQPSTLYGSNWHTKPVDFKLNLAPDNYYVALKGLTATDKGNYQLQIGEPAAKVASMYTPPTWTEVKDALATSDVHVLPVIATGGDNSTYRAAAEAQAQTVALTTGAQRKDGTPIWQKIQKDGTGTGSGLVTGIAEIADYLAMDVSLVAVDGPDPGASKFRISVAPVNSPSCLHPHPLVDSSTGACTPRPGNSPGYNCNTQYACAPGSVPKFTVTFTNPADAPVPPNTNDAYGGYRFKLQIIGDKKYLLDEIPVYIIPTTNMTMGPPSGPSGKFQTSGVYQQDMVGGQCPRIGDAAFATNDLPNWSDLFFNADIPEGSSIDFELCTANDPSDLGACQWWNGSNMRKKVTIRAKGVCTNSSQCRNISGYGDGFCSDYGTCQFVSPAKIAFDVPCGNDSVCPNGPLGAGDYVIASRCERTTGAAGFGYCVYMSQPADLGGTLLSGEQGRAYARVRVTMNSDAAGQVAPTLYQWYLTYQCRTSQ